MCPKYGDPQRSTAAIILDTKTGNYQEYDDGLKGGVEWWSWGWGGGGGLEGVMISILKTHQTFYSQSKSIKMLYICFSRSVWNLGVIFYDRLSMKQQVSKICQSAYPELRRISSIRHVLTVAATKTHVTSLVLSCLDYLIPCCQGFFNSWLTNFKRFKIVLLHSFSKLPNAYISPLLAKLHWLPIAKRIDYKTFSTTVLLLSALFCSVYKPDS